MFDLSNLKIGARLGLGFALLLLLQLVITGIGLHQMTNLSDRIAFATEVGARKLDLLNNVQSAIGKRAIAARNLALVSDPAAQKGDIDLVGSSQREIDAGLQNLAAVMAAPDASTPEERRMLEKLRALEAQYLPIAKNVVDLATSRQTDAAVKVLTQECMDYWDFDCRFGASKESAEVIHLSAITGLIDGVAKEGGKQFYIEILAKPAKRKVRPAVSPESESPEEG